MSNDAVTYEKFDEDERRALEYATRLAITTLKNEGFDYSENIAILERAQEKLKR